VDQIGPKSENLTSLEEEERVKVINLSDIKGSEFSDIFDMKEWTFSRDSQKPKGEEDKDKQPLDI
jgi:hypothetical protein